MQRDGDFQHAANFTCLPICLGTLRVSVVALCAALLHEVRHGVAKHHLALLLNELGVRFAGIRVQGLDGCGLKAVLLFLPPREGKRTLNRNAEIGL